jgi:hypothetical protein
LTTTKLFFSIIEGEKIVKRLFKHISLVLCLTPTMAQAETLQLRLPLIVQAGTGRRLFIYFPQRDSSNRYVFQYRTSPVPARSRNPQTPQQGSSQTGTHTLICSSLNFVTPNFKAIKTTDGGIAYYAIDSDVDEITLSVQCNH